jgi:hypothetical protein
MRPLALFDGGSAGVTALKIVTGLLVLCAGAALTYVALPDRRPLGLVPVDATDVAYDRMSAEMKLARASPRLNPRGART